MANERTSPIWGRTSQILVDLAVHTLNYGRDGRPYSVFRSSWPPIHTNRVWWPSIHENTVSVRRSQTGGCRCAGKLSNDSVTVNKRNNNIYFLPDWVNIKCMEFRRNKPKEKGGMCVRPTRLTTLPLWKKGWREISPRNTNGRGVCTP